jgi:hypothetical protein
MRSSPIFIYCLLSITNPWGAHAQSYDRNGTAVWNTGNSQYVPEPAASETPPAGWKDPQDVPTHPLAAPPFVAADEIAGSCCTKLGPRAQLALFDGPHQVQITYTDTGGKFRFRQLDPQKTYQIIFIGEGSHRRTIATTRPGRWISSK